MMVARVWAKHGLKPQRLDRYMASNDPDFERKAADIIGLYVNPPAHAAVFCVDEKTAIQALDRKDPVLPLSPGRAERHGFEYYRHGTLSCTQRSTPKPARGGRAAGSNLVYPRSSILIRRFVPPDGSAFGRHLLQTYKRQGTGLLHPPIYNND